jgi:eukaryotic-like serine/threonine-protein kinase
MSDEKTVGSSPVSVQSSPRGFRTRFRVDSDSSLSGGEDLEDQLRKRLRVQSFIWALATLMLGATALARNVDQIRKDPSLLFTAPPLPGILLLITITTAIFLRLLSPGRRLPLHALRAIEWVGVFQAAAFFAFNQWLSLHLGTVLDIHDNSMDLGAGLGAPWGAIIVAYGVLIPSSMKHCLLRTIVLTIVAFIPEMLTFPGTIGLSGGAPVFLATKFVLIGSMSALAIYGAYRIDVLSKDAYQARQLGQYRLGRLLGRGGMGEVHLAEHQFLRRACAVKLIRPEQAGNEETLARFEREVRAAAKLTHPNTIQIYDYGRAEDGTFYYAMEYLPGISLQDLVNRHGPLPPARATHVLTQICGALREAHSHGLVHRDLKPANVMLCERGGVHDVVKLLDYGLVVTMNIAEEEARLTRTGMVLGTPEFMSPEQCAGDTNLTGASDIYSLGAVAYYLVCGKAPFSGRSTVQTLAAHLYETPTPVRETRTDISAELEQVIMRCLEKMPEKRYSDIDALEAAIMKTDNSASWTAADARDWWQANK